MIFAVLVAAAIIGLAAFVYLAREDTRRQRAKITRFVRRGWAATAGCCSAFIASSGDAQETQAVEVVCPQTVIAARDADTPAQD